jgi:hypothetical protein
MGFEGAEAQPIPAVGLRSFGPRDREDRPRPAFTHLATLRWPMVGIMPALLWRLTCRLKFMFLDET